MLIRELQFGRYRMYARLRNVNYIMSVNDVTVDRRY